MREGIVEDREGIRPALIQKVWRSGGSWVIALPMAWVEFNALETEEGLVVEVEAIDTELRIKPILRVVQ